MNTYIRTEDIARELDSVQRMNPENLMTGWFSGLDQAVLRLVPAYPQLGPPLRKFSGARTLLWPDRLTDVAWQEMQEAARNMAAAVRELGDIAIPLCNRPTRWGKRLQALVNGACAMNWHETGKEDGQ